MVITEKECKNCGAPVQLESEESPGRYADVLLRVGVLCDPCEDAERAEDAKHEQEMAASRRNQRHLERTLQSGMPDHLRGCNSKTLDRDIFNAEGLDAGRAWATGEIRGLLLTGTVGSGKTFTAAAAANSFMYRAPLRWFSVSKMMAQARAGFKHPSRDDLYDVLLNPRIALVLDDIDKAKVTDFAREILFQAIDERVNYGSSLLVTTNATYIELEENYGEPIASRLGGYCKPVNMAGTDRRLPKSQ